VKVGHCQTPIQKKGSVERLSPFSYGCGNDRYDIDCFPSPVADAVSATQSIDHLAEQQQ